MVDIMLFTMGMTSPQLMTNYVDVDTMTPDNNWWGTVSTDNTSLTDLGLDADLDGGNTTVTSGRPSFWAFNTLSLVWDGIRMLARFTFSPLYFLSSVQAPLPIILILGLIPSVAFIIALISFILGRSL